MSDEPIALTDARGQTRWPRDYPEPEPSSVVLTNGEFGTAYQRYFSDGKWHRVGGGRPRDWEYLLGQRNLVLVYGAPERSK